MALGITPEGAHMRNAAFFATGVLLIILQSNLYRVLGPLGLHGASPDLILPLIVFLGVHEPSMARGVVLAFSFGYVLDVFGGAPMWLFRFVSVAIWWLARMAGVRLVAQTVITRMSLALAFSLAQSAIILILLAIFGDDTRRPVEIGAVMLPHAIATALFAPLIFRLAQKLHQASAPVHASGEAIAR
jgi:rod shape-determining protein MreD